MAPPIPNTPTASSAGPFSTQVSWRKISGSGINYLLFRNGVQILRTKDNDALDTGLSDGVSYTYTVAATDQSGTSAQSAGATVFLPKIILFRLNDVLFVGTGDPSNVVVASPPALWLRTDGGSNTTLYVKESGVNTATGWTAK